MNDVQSKLSKLPKVDVNNISEFHCNICKGKKFIMGKFHSVPLSTSEDILVGCYNCDGFGSYTWLDKILRGY